jgi:hypothetical protein
MTLINWILTCLLTVTDCLITKYIQVKAILWPTLSWPVRPGVRPPSGTCDQFFFQCNMVYPLWQEGGSVIYGCCLALPVQSVLSPSPVALMTVVYCFNLDTPPILRKLKFKLSYDQRSVSQSVYPGLRPPSGTCEQFFFLSTEIILRHIWLLLVWSALSDERMGL